MNGHHLTYNLSSSTKKLLLNKDLASEILSQLNECRLQKRFTDAVLSVDQEELHCHRCVLAASSPYFQASFSSHFQEALECRVILHEVSPWIMKRILEYIYTGQLEITLESAVDYLRTGHMLQYPDIVNACCELLSQHLHPTNCLGFKELSSLYHCNELETTAYNYVLEHFSSVIEQSEELSNLSLTSFISYLSADNADICNESIMWRAISQWVNFDAENRRQYLPQLLSCVRLSELTAKELKMIGRDPLVQSQPKCVLMLEKASKKCHDKVKTLCDTRGDLLLHQSARPSTLPRDMIVSFGGSSGYELAETACYDPLKGRWSTLPPLPENIVRASITAYDSTIFITGGIVNHELSDGLWIFCCKERRWTRGKAMLKARARHSSVVLNGVLYVSGGVRLSSNQIVVPMTDIHAYHLKAGVWKRAGCNNTPKLDGNLLGINDILYELGGHSDGSYTRTMETYRVASNGHVSRTEEHYVLPCTGEPGPLRAALYGEQIIILWENSGHLFSLNTNGGRFFQISHSLERLSGCLVAFDENAYILGGSVDGKPCTVGVVLSLSSESHRSVSLPAGLLVQKCVRVVM